MTDEHEVEMPVHVEFRRLGEWANPGEPRSRRQATLLALWAGLGLIPLLALGCMPHQVRMPAEWQAPARRPGMPLVSVITPNAEPVVPLVQALNSELATDFDVAVTTLDQMPSSQHLARRLHRQEPSLLVLVDNSSVELYAEAVSALRRAPPAIVVMASFVEQVIGRIPNAVGIAYETPAVTAFSDVRRLFGRRVKRVGVIYRWGFEGFIELERTRARAEDIEVLGFSVPAEPSLLHLSRALREMERAKVDAVWITNDNALLRSSFLSSAWKPFSEVIDAPVVVGVPGLLSPPLQLGTFAAIPDTAGVGVQAADLIYALRDTGFVISGERVQPSISTKTFVSLRKARRLGFPVEHEHQVDVVVDRYQ